MVADVTVPMLEGVRRRLRELVKLIDNNSASLCTRTRGRDGRGDPIVLPGFSGEHRMRSSGQKREHSSVLIGIT